MLELLPLMSVLFGVSALVIAVVAAVLVLRFPRFQTRDAAFLLSVACIVGGFFVASVATPDWSPLTMLGLYMPFLAIGVLMGFVSSRRSRRGAGVVDAIAGSTDCVDGGQRNRLWIWLLAALGLLVAIPVVFVLGIILWDSITLQLMSLATGL